MFDQLRKAFSNATKSITQRELTEKDANNVLTDFEIELLQSDIAQEVIDVIVTKLKSELTGIKLEKEQDAENVAKIKFRDAILEMFSRAGEVDLIRKIIEKKDNKGGPFVVVFLGINGTGKTTTVAKVAHFLRTRNISVVLAAADTHRAGAIEQISRHAERLSLKVIAQRYGADPSAVGRDAIDYAKKHHIDAVLVDTAGRMQTAKNLMDEVNKIVRVVRPDVKLFVGDSLAGNDTINQAKEFFEYTNFDGAILTKIDADAKGGSAISIVHITSRPIIYLGIGQGYDDIVPFDASRFVDSIISGIPLTNTISKVIPTTIEDSPPDKVSMATQSMEGWNELPSSEPVTIPDRQGNSVLADSSTPVEEGKKTEQDIPKQVGSRSKFITGSTPISDSSLRNLPPTITKSQQNGEQGKHTHPDVDKVAESVRKETASFDRVKEIAKISPTSHPNDTVTGRSEIIDAIDRKNKKPVLGGFFSRWARGRNNKESGKTDGLQTESESRLDKAEKSSKNKIKEGQSSSPEHTSDRPGDGRTDVESGNDKHEGETVYLSDEEIEDMLK
jgi:fused signal recognition particle receptor